MFPLRRMPPTASVATCVRDVPGSASKREWRRSAPRRATKGDRLIVTTQAQPRRLRESFWICPSRHAPERCHRLQIQLDEFRDGELRLLTCPRCHWTVPIENGIAVFDDRILPRERRAWFRRAIRERGLATQPDIRNVRKTDANTGRK